MPPHQISLKEMWLHSVCSELSAGQQDRAMNRLLQLNESDLETALLRVRRWSVCVLLESVLNTFGRNTGDTLRETLRQTSWSIFPLHSQCHLVQRFGRKDRLGQEVLFRYGMEASPVRIEKNKQTHKDAPVLASLFRAMLWNRAFCGDGKVPFLGCPTPQSLVMGEYWAPAVWSVPPGNWAANFISFQLMWTVTGLPCD